MDHDLSIQAKQTFSIVTLLATVLVVGIHYKSDVPDLPDATLATWNQLGQEFLFGGVARVAVPVFAFAAGLFYFRSDDGTFGCYCKKLSDRVRTVAIPFFIVGSVAMTFWLLVRRSEGKPIDLTMAEFLSTWWLRPPAEQLWFLRDLMVLVVIAPVIRWLGSRTAVAVVALALIGGSWLLDFQWFPPVAGWRILQMETLLFFMLGCMSLSRRSWIEMAGRASLSVIALGWLIWSALVAIRIYLRADFDIWYADDHGIADLLLHQSSILVGTVVLYMTAWRMRHRWLLYLASGSFFVYLVHEFPLRAIAHRLTDRFMDPDYSCWLLTPVVLVGCYATAMLLGRFCPAAMAMLTGGRIPRPAPSNVAPSNVAVSNSPSRRAEGVK
ncbi:acyltransferase family protein [Rubripirellula lacrimiformis]|uniref:acyltransferase family protein n=1 Tax=Rubripirellula lacrimiformis TaxID=1930273 RepID=UPI001C54DC5A|nr:acyltransferase [Rubripirellula lacrimiformis]